MLGATVLLGGIGTAQAAEPGSNVTTKAAAYTPESICGSGYYVQE